MPGPFGLVSAVMAAVLVVGMAVAPAAAAPAAAGGGVTAYYNISGPSAIVTGPDGNLWFTNASNDTIGKITPAGAVTIYTGPGIAQPSAIASDGTWLWFTNNGFGGGDTIGRINPTTGVITSYTASGIRALRGITLGPDGAMWFTSHGIPAIGRITPDGTISVYPNSSLQGPEGITAGSDGGLWFTDDSGNIGRIDPNTKGFAMLFTSLAGTVRPTSIVTGPDGNLWFTNQGTQDDSGNQIDASIASISTSGVWGGIYRDPSIVSPQGITVGPGPDPALWFTNQSAPTVCPPCGTPSSIGQISTAGVISFTDPSLDQPFGITNGPDGALWFTNMGGGGLGDSIGRITTGGTVSVYEGNHMYAPGGIVTGPDGALWFTNSGGGSGNPNYSSIGRITAAGAITWFSSPGPPWNIAQPFAIVVGPDRNLWFTNNGWGGGDMIGRITTSGVITSYSVGRGELGITSGPDGALWFTSPSGQGVGPAIGRITTAGTITNVYTDPRMTGPEEITTGRDGALWFTDDSNQIGRITKQGSFTFFSDPRIQSPRGIVAGPDGALWFTNSGTYDDQGNLTGSSIGRITTNGKLTFYTDTSIVSPNGITTGPDGAIWFTSNGTIGRITTAGQVGSYAAVGVNGQPQEITTGPDGAMWFTELNNVVGRIETSVTPQISGFTPTAGAVGTNVTITGVNLGRATQVAFNGTTATIVSNSSSTIVVRVPLRATTGLITVTTPVGMATSAGTFTVLADAHTVLLDHFDGSTVGTAYGSLSFVPSQAGFGQAGVFGLGTYVKYAMAPSTTNAGTVEMWIRPTSGLTATTGLLNFNWNDTPSPPPTGWVLQMLISSSSTVPPNVLEGSSVTGNRSIPLNRWSHVALTWSPTSTKLYLNGVLTGSGPGSPPSIAQNYWVYLNYWGAAQSGPFTGLIDELKISDVERSAAEIRADAK